MGVYLLVGASLAGLMAYVWAGREIAPFHGDEADQLYRSYEAVVIFEEGNPQELAVKPPVRAHTVDHLRMLTGTTTIYLSGYALRAKGVEEWEWPQPWFYGEDVAWNRTAGRWPVDKYLHQGRIPTTILTMLAVPLMFALGWRLVNGEEWLKIAGGLASTLLLTTQPVWLLNGRRLMQEAALGTLTLLLVWIAIGLATRPRWWRMIMLGAVAGLCMAAKLTGFLPVGLLFAALGIHIFLWHNKRWLAALAASAWLATGMFLLLTPVFWDAPLERFQLAIDLRREVLAGQTAASDEAYENPVEQGAALFTQPFLSEVQYYESADFEGVLDETIVVYELSGVAGWQMPSYIGIFWTLMTGIGLVNLLQRWHESAVWIVLVWVIGVGLALGISVPLAWGRYYLPWILPVCLLAGIGLSEILKSLPKLVNRKYWKNLIEDV
jgi:4-amino-4-deoxy-L-arabinose transferase-like glycosyltransferase